MNNWISVKDRWWRVYGTRTKSDMHRMSMPDPSGESGPPSKKEVSSP